MAPPFAVQLDPSFDQMLTHQSYGAGPDIAGVALHRLRKHRSSNGAFMEFLRLDAEGVEGLPTRFIPRQINVSWAEPGRINAFHIHVRQIQNEIWVVAQGSVIAWLADMRRDSPSRGVRKSFVLTAEEPAMLLIPSGVAHGYRAGRQGALLLYAMDAQFDPENPNEGRIPWDCFGPDIWEDDRG